MKVERKDQGFQPVVITLETREELQLVSDLFSILNTGRLQNEELRKVFDSTTIELAKMTGNFSFTYIDQLESEIVIKDNP